MKNNINILVVDDDPVIIKSAWGVLNREGYTVEGVLSGEDAMQRIEQNNYDIAFVDLSMPGMDGIALIKRIRQSRPGVSIVVFADHKMQETIKQAHKLGISSHMNKPFTPEILKEVTNKTIELMKVKTSENESKEEVAPAKLAELDEVIHHYKERFNSAIMVLLHAQKMFGYLSSTIQEHIARGLNIYPSEIRSIVSIYSCFKIKPGSNEIPCYITGGGRLQMSVPWKTGRKVIDAVNEFIIWRQLEQAKR